MKINKEEIDLILNDMQTTELECQKIGSTVVGDDAEYLIGEQCLKFISNNGCLIRLALEQLKEIIKEQTNDEQVNELKVNCTTAYKGSIFVGTDKGLYYIDGDNNFKLVLVKHTESKEKA